MLPQFKKLYLLPGSFQVLSASVNAQQLATVVLETPLTRITQLRLEVLSIDQKDTGSLRVEFLGCEEGTSKCSSFIDLLKKRYSAILQEVLCQEHMMR